MKNRNKNNNDNNIMIRQSMILMMLNVIQSTLNSLHPLINPVNTSIDVPHVEPSGVQALKNPNPLKDVEAFVVLDVAVLV